MKQEPRPAIHMEKQLGWTCKLGGAESLGISEAGQTVLGRLMESHVLYQLVGFVVLCGEGSEERQWPLLTCMSDSSVSPCMLLGPFKLLPCAGAQRE